METYPKAKWFLNISEIELGGSSVLGQNYVAFYIIHIVALSLLTISALSSAVVMVSILGDVLQRKNNGNRRRLVFADRIPIYLAVSDGLFCIAHFVDHLYLVTIQHYPSNYMFTVMVSIITWSLLGYQRLMHAGVAIYTYIRVVRGVDVNLGRGEWKLHAAISTFIASSVGVFWPFGAFGLSGYWILEDARTKGGIAVGCYVTVASIAQSSLTALSYRQVKVVVEKQKMALMQFKLNNKGKSKGTGCTASECLTTYLIIAQAIYCPLPFVYCAHLVHAMFGVIEPITVLLVVITGCSSGWANSLGYFYNMRIKSIRERMVKTEKLTMTSGSSFHSNSTLVNKTDRDYY